MIKSQLDKIDKALKEISSKGIDIDGRDQAGLNKIAFEVKLLRDKFVPDDQTSSIDAPET